MRRISWIFVPLFCLFPTISFAQNDLAGKQDLIKKKEADWHAQESNIQKKRAELQRLISSLDSLKRDAQIKQDKQAQAKDAYSRASQNVDIMTPQQLGNFLTEYQNADKELRMAEGELKKAERDKGFAERELQRLQDQQIERRIEIYGLQAELYDASMREAVWVEGAGESILDENKTMKQAQDLALEYARRDAIEKGGKMLIESLTQVEMFQLIKDEIKMSAKVQVIEQDQRGDFGKVNRVVAGDLIKFTAKVRLKVQSVATYNPYRERIKELKGDKAAASLSPSVGGEISGSGGLFSVESIAGWGTDFSDGSSVCFYSGYPNLAFSDDPDRCKSGWRAENASWRGNYRIEKNKLTLEAHDIRSQYPPSHELGIGYTVTLRGAKFKDGSRTKIFILYRFSGIPSKKDVELEVPLNVER